MVALRDVYLVREHRHCNRPGSCASHRRRRRTNTHAFVVAQINNGSRNDIPNNFDRDSHSE